MAGRREHVQLCPSTTSIRPSLNGLHQVVIDTDGNLVGIYIVVAEEGRVVADILTHDLLAFPILLARLQQRVHRIAMVLEDVFLQRSKAVGNGAEARTLDIGGVVTGTTAIVVAAFLDAVIDVKAEEGGWGIEREHPLDVVVYR